MSGLNALLDRADAAVLEGARTGITDAIQDLHAASRDLAPLDKGTLRRESWTEYSETKNEIAGEVIYSVRESSDDSSYDYALWMHEFGGKPAYANPTTPGTQPKFLEQPLKERADTYRQWITENIRNELGG